MDADFGTICLDFNKMVMNFENFGKQIELKGIKGPTHKVVEGGVATKELRRKKIVLLC